MYDELVKRLRASVDGLHEKCDGCPYEEDYPCCVDCLDKMHKQAADAIEELSNPKWISVTERLPRYGTPVLAYGSRGGIFVAKYERKRAEWGADYWWKLNSSIHECNPTHWMPLPEPPKEE